MTSILVAFNLALAKALVKAGLIDKQELANEFREVRKVVGNQSPIAAAEKEILNFLEVNEEEKTDGA